MKKTLKITGTALIVLIALLILFPLLFKGKIIKTINTEANKQLNAVLHFENAHLSLLRDFPNFNLRIYELSLAGKDTFANDTLVKFQSFEAEINLSSVLSGEQYDISKLILNKAQIQARVLKDGTANWDIMLPDTAQDNDTEDTKTDTSRTAPVIFELSEVVLNDSRIIYDDKELGVFADTEGLNFEMSGDLSQEHTNLDIQMLIRQLTVQYEGIAYLYKVNTEFSGILKADLKDWIFTFEENTLSLNKVLLEFAGNVAMPGADIVTDITFKSPDTDFKNALSLIPQIYQKDFEGIQASGTFKLSGFVKGLYNEDTMPGYGMDLRVKDSRFSYPDLPESVENINIAMNVKAKEGSGDDITTDIEKAHIEMAGNPFDASVYAALTADDTYTRGNIKGTIDFGSLAKLIPLDDTKINGFLKTDMSFDGKLSDIENENYQNFKAGGYFNLSNFELSGPDYPEVFISEADMNLSPQYMALNAFKAKSGKSDFELSGRVDNILNYAFADEVLTGKFNFKSSLIDIDQLAGLDDTTEEPDATRPDQESSEIAESDEIIRIPENINFELNSAIAKMLYDGMEITDTKGKIILREGVLLMENLSMNTLDGNIRMNGAYNSKPAQPPVDFDLALSEIDIQALFKQFVTVQKMAPLAEYCTGNISAQIAFDSRLENDMMPDYSTLNSRGKLKSREIGIKNNSLFANLGKKTKLDFLKNPVLKDINLSYEIKNGNLEVEPTEFKVKDSKMLITGTHNLNKSIDFDLDIELPAHYAEQILQKAPESVKLPKTIETKVKIGGTSDNPKITGVENNLAQGLRETAEEKIEDIKEDLKGEAEKIMKDAKEKADALIDAAEKQADNIRAEAEKSGDKLIEEAQKQGQKLIDQANNPIKKLAAEKTAEKLVETAKKQAAKLEKEADAKAETLTDKARKEADEIMENARKKADTL